MSVQTLHVMKIKTLLLLRAALLILCLTGSASGQGSARFLVEENVRNEAQGVLLGRVLAGTVLPVLSVEGQWTQLQVEGWIWTRSVQATDRLGFDRVVSVSPQENLRSEPSGEVVARLVEGTLLNRVEDVPGWTRIRRTVWVWSASVEVTHEGPRGTSPSPSPPGAPTAGAPTDGGWWRSDQSQLPVLTAPDGDTLAFAQAGTELRVLAREGNWIRVRLEGWSWAPEGVAVDAPASEAVELTPEDVIQDPEAHRGKTVTWELQFISVERAEKIRTDFYEGEPFLLTRTGAGESLFVYVAVPPDRLGEVEGLVPLERIRVVGRVRAGAAALTGNPILELLEFTRLSRD